MTKKSFLHWRNLNSKVIFQHPRITLAEDQVQLPEGQITNYLKFINQGNAVTIICLKDSKVLIQQEYSYPPNEILYQFPGGKIEEKETPIQAAKRELSEESNYTITKLENLGWYYLNNRRSDSKMYVVLATAVIKAKHESTGDPEENIQSEWISISKLNQMILKGLIVNFSLLAAWTLFSAKYKT
jgi:ADP-ribose pyrophosphatase